MGTTVKREGSVQCACNVYLHRVAGKQNTQTAIILPFPCQIQAGPLTIKNWEMLDSVSKSTINSVETSLTHTDAQMHLTIFSWCV